MRIVMIAPGYEPTTGGVETHVAGLARALCDAGRSVEVWVPERGADRVRSEIRSGVAVTRFPSSGSSRFPVAPGLYRFARRHLDGTALVHAHSFHNVAAAAVLAARPAVPFVFTPHYHGGGHTPLARLAHGPYRPIGRRIVTRARAVVAVSAAEAMLIRRDFSGVTPTVIHNGADTTDIHVAAPLSDQPPTLLVLGRLESYKRVDAVLAAFDAAHEPGRLVVIGDGTDRSRLESIADSLGRRDDVTFLGRIPRPDVLRWLRTARGVVSMSEHEAFGLVALESVAAGGAAVLSDLPAHREVAGILPADRTVFSTHDSADLAAALDAVLRRTNSGPHAVRDWGHVAAEHLGIYESVLDRA